MTGTGRISPQQVSPEIYKAIAVVDQKLYGSSLGKALIELVKVRISQINGCAFCLDMHSQAAIKAGVSERKLILLGGWHEAAIWSERERAALGWAEAVTKIGGSRASDAEYDALVDLFDTKEIADLTMLIGLMNLWNRLAIAMRYQIQSEVE
ncbi:alkylhydroperoxidase AhpD family core domain-containing protein [Paracoccus halophilus]|uniref:Alkylhydroperoxidase AhpD family core domain-containing protein n=1 Tax=Paracoccus halophilus TaxID=376733 RepID=A0A1I0TX64_9RHOB|nr:alkylhydroperoxidase AhpD family core domain-containing protein [Paracoccus halophilus]